MLRLQNQVLRVDGAVRSVLLDLARGRLHRIPRSIAQQLEGGTIDDAGADDHTRRWLDLLIADGYLAAGLPPLWQPYRMPDGIPFTPQFHTLAVSGAIPTKSLTDWLGPATARIRHIVVHAQDGQRAVAAALAQELAILCRCEGYEIAFREHGQERAEIHRVDRRRIASKTILPLGARLRDKFQIDHRTASLLATRSEGAGYLFIDSDKTIKPHRDETTVVYGSMDTHSLDEIIAGEEFLAVAWNSKSRRATCRDCEFHLACLHSFVDRCAPDDLASAPTGCPYDPYSADPQSDVC